MTDLPVDAVHVWHARLPSNWTPPVGVLSQMEHDKVARIKRSDVAVLKAFSYWVRREILSRYLSIKPEDILFGEGEHGKPFIANEGVSLAFNVSDTEGLVVLAIAHEAVGIDVEPTSRNMEPGLARHILSEAEMRYWQKLSADESSTFLLSVWVAKEAYVKCIGKGLQWELPGFSVMDERGQLLSPDPSMSLQWVSDNLGSVMAVCANEKNKNNQIDSFIWGN